MVPLGTPQERAAKGWRWLGLALAASASCAQAEPARDASLGSSDLSVVDTTPPSALPNQPSDSQTSDASSKAAASADSNGSGFTELQIPGFLPAVVYRPAATTPRPLIVATHGAGGAPDYDCEYWKRLSQGRAFVLCLRGTPFGRGAAGSFYYKNHLELGRELKAALTAARAAYGSRLAAGAGVYSGFSQGATMGVGMIENYGAELSHLVLIEGGYDYWSVARAKKYRANGGRRVLFACGTQWCADKSEKAASWLRQAGLEARVEYAPGVGHTPMGEVMGRVAAALPWLLSGDPVWQPS